MESGWDDNEAEEDWSDMQLMQEEDEIVLPQPPKKRQKTRITREDAEKLPDFLDLAKFYYDYEELKKELEDAKNMTCEEVLTTIIQIERTRVYGRLCEQMASVSVAGCILE